MNKKILLIIIIITTVIGVIAIGVLHGVRTTRDNKLANFKMKMDYFGKVDDYDLINNLEKVWCEYHDKGYNGIDDPYIIENINLWENKGIKGWSNIDDAEWDRRLRVIAEKHGTNSGVYKDCEKLINGGYNILGETDYLRFGEAIQEINYAQSEFVGSGSKSTILTQWLTMLGRSD